MATLTRSMLRDQIREVLLERILEGEYEPGSRIIETQVAQELSVSQAPVREALRELEVLGMVTSEPYRGVRVREVTYGELAEIYPVRAAIEEVAAVAAAETLSKDVSKLERQQKAMAKAADAGDLHRLLKHDVEFHRIIIEASGNKILLQVWTSLRIEARTFITLLARGDRDPHEVAESHLPVIDAFRSGDARRAGRALRKHVEFFATWLPAE